MHLRPAGPDDEPFLAHVRRPEIAGEFNAFDDPDGERVKGDVSRMIVVHDDGTPIGAMRWHGVAYGPYRRSPAWNFGITIVPEHRGRGHGAGGRRRKFGPRSRRRAMNDGAFRRLLCTHRKEGCRCPREDQQGSSR